MPTILYNANSSLISRFHRKVKSRTDQTLNEFGKTRFLSSFEKDTPEYLRELCCSAYPKQIHAQLETCNSAKLAAHAFFALVFKNFVCSWFGPKIPSTDPEFLCELYHIIDRLLCHFEEHEIEWESLLLDDVPLLLTQHLRAVRRAARDGWCDEARERALLDPDYDRARVSSYVCSLLKSESHLQTAFLRSLFEDLLCDRILHSIADPSLVLEAVNKVARSLACPGSPLPGGSREENSQSWRQRLVCLKTYVYSENDQQFPADSKPFLHRYVFTFVKCFTAFERRKPLLYAFCKYCQALTARRSPVNRILHKLFYNFVKTKLASVSRVSGLFLTLRHIVFPTDTTMGPPRVPLDDQQKSWLQLECEENIMKLLERFRLTSIFGLGREDVRSFVVAISLDQEMNTLLLERLMACFVAHAT
ncbi:LAQU0S04e08416g1_1 [Lachancea quebecensis]|uniref:LAQU0S04e08416g1_1 n=1 Tax=Lachancea quebecensis TaxID=1654605 RepID=A0A0N7MLF1_9SACH|nr:LAQU0S04e08416g1_1 [Lachancea quebecensis]